MSCGTCRTRPATRSRCSTRCPTAAPPIRRRSSTSRELRDRIADAIAALPEREDWLGRPKAMPTALQRVQLTYDKGKQDSYNGGYQAGRAAGYDSPDGFTKGRAKGYADGRAAGRADVLVCSDASFAGLTDGYNDGVALGLHDGYQDGYKHGYNAGYPIGMYACAPSGGNAAQDQNECRTRGHDEKYNAAYETAKIANKDYQRGLADGKTLGYADGFEPGRQAGYNEGVNVGYTAGFNDGKQENYTICYNLGYENGAKNTATQQTEGGKLRAYNNSYFDTDFGRGLRPIVPSHTNGIGGEGDGFNDGWVDGRFSICGASLPIHCTLRLW